MKRIIVVAAGIATLVIASPFVLTKVEEQRLMRHDRFAREVGYALPDSSRITDTNTMIWSIADGDNYSWIIESPKPLLPWIQAIGTVEYDQTYRVSATLPDGRTETSYISLGPSVNQAKVDTFRP